MNLHNANLLAQYPTLWTRHDVDAVVALFTDDCCYEDAALRWTHRGKHELREFAAKVFTMHADFRLRYLSSFATVARGAAEWVIDATFQDEFEGVVVPATAISFRGATLFEFRDGKISRNTDFWDYADWMRQLGITRLAPRVDAAGR